MSSKTRVIVIGITVGAVLAIGLFFAGFAVGLSTRQIQGVSLDLPATNSAPTSTLIPPNTSVPIPTPSEDRATLFEPFWRAWGIIHDQYVDQPVDDLKLMRGAIRGMLEVLGDQHTTYMNPDEYMQANIPLDGTYEGIGAWVDPTAEYLTIVSPMPGSPAEASGLKPGDQIVAVDGEDMSGVDGNLVIRRVLGPAGSTVKLTIKREGEPNLLEFEIVRETITIPSVISEMLEENIAYIQLTTFAGDTTRDLRIALEDLLVQNPEGLILDLRNNGGGFLNTAIEVASEFIPDGQVMTEKFGDGSEKVYEAISGGLATEIPLVVLINGGSASASEIVAGAIQDRGRGTLVGETSFGKGSVQNWVPLPEDGGAVRVTIARWYTPEGRLIHEIGLTPDIEVIQTDEEIEAEIDSQLEKAIELLLSDAVLE
jgi:carboxyl-terminal processing protease